MIPDLKPQHAIFMLLPATRWAICLTPKVASSSIIQTLAVHYGSKTKRPYHRYSIFKWLTLDEINTVAPDYHRAMFVRNPFDRLVGCYDYHIRAMGTQMSLNMRKLGFRADMLFDEFLRKVTANTEADPHFAIQAWQTDRYNFLGKFESLKADWDRLGKEIGVQPWPRLQASNQSNREFQSYTAYYTPELKGMVERAYRIDLETFGYAFK